MSNQTTVRKQSDNADNIPRLMYNNLVLDSVDDRTKQSKDSMYYEETETNSYSYEEIKHNMLSSHQSPKLKILPTPKAIQPGFGFDMN